MRPDSGIVFIDQNAARNPRFPLEPLFRALSTENPEYNIADVDIVTDRNNIRKLLRFVQGSSSDPFEIRIEIAGQKTALFTRVEHRTKELIHSFRGFGHSFEDAYTQRQLGSTGHHRIVGYNFGGLKLVVRHETDGYVEDTSSVELGDSLSNALGGLSISNHDISTKDSIPTGSRPGGLVVTTYGKAVDRASTLEIKTRTASRTLDMAEVFSQLWISQTPKLVVGYHQNGLFNDVQLKDMAEHLRQWETDHQKDLYKLAGLLVKILRMARRIAERRVIVSFDGGTKLSIAIPDPTGVVRALPDDLYAMWESKGFGKREIASEHSTQSEAGATAEQKNLVTESQAKDNRSGP